MLRAFFGAVLIAVAVSSCALVTTRDQSRTSLADLLTATSQEFALTSAEDDCITEMVGATKPTDQYKKDLLGNAWFVCVPRVVDDPVWMEQTRAAFSRGLGAEASTDEVRCFFREAIARSESPGLLLGGYEDTAVQSKIVETCLSAELWAEIRSNAESAGP